MTVYGSSAQRLFGIAHLAGGLRQRFHDRFHLVAALGNLELPAGAQSDLICPSAISANAIVRSCSSSTGSVPKNSGQFSPRTASNN